MPSLEKRINEIRIMDQHINMLLESAKTIREAAENDTSAISNLPRPATPDPHRRESVYAKLADLESEVTACIDSLVDMKADVILKLSKVADQDMIKVINYRYFRNMQWKDISIELGVSESKLVRLNRKLVKDFFKIDC